jgi:hypothetical protein
MAPYPTELRVRVVAAVEEGGGIHSRSRPDFSGWPNLH